MKRTHLNFVIDTVAFAGFSFLAATGMVLLYQLPPGSGGRQGFGTGHGASERSIELLWGLTRHEWGNIHYWTALILMSVLAIHLFLHWNWVAGVIRGKPSTASPHRFAIGIVGLASVVLLSVLPFATPTTSTTRGELQQYRSAQSGAETSDAAGNKVDAESANTDGDDESGSLGIRGSMTLDEIAREYQVNVGQIIVALRLPANTAPNEKAGRLLRQHGLEMGDLRRVVEDLRSQPTKEEQRNR